MRAGIRSISCHHRRSLQTGWSICTTPAVPSNPTQPPSDAIWVAAPLLGSLADILRARGEWSLDDPPRRFDSEDVWYRLKFAASPTETPAVPTILGFDGLATVAHVWLNGQLLLSSDNMFLAQECDVTASLLAGSNELLIRFSALDLQLAQRRPRPRWRAPMVENQQLRWFRTTLLGRTPGWSPPAAVVGAWKDIWLEERPILDASSLKTRTSIESGDGSIEVSFQLHGLCNGSTDFQAVYLELRRNGRIHRTPLIPEANGQCSGVISIEAVDLWWPHTHGEPALYEACITVQLETSFAEIQLGRVGFRQITVKTTDGDFEIQVNGVPIFCRGACWTPLDVVSLRASDESNRKAITQAQTAGMNMLRVTGTMVYEDDAFLDACDELGMLVWQDFMFANLDYPESDSGFIRSVELEALQQLSRWQTHPCMAVVCGNSEVEQQAAMWGSERSLWQPKLFHEMLRDWCASVLPDLPYWPSSAHGGSFPHQNDEGTTSYYGVGAYLRPLDDARKANVRFATECLAFANVPSSSAIGRLPGSHSTRVHHPGWKARSPRDLGAGWDFDDVRDHYVATLFNLDPQKLRYADHDRYLTLSRIATGEAMAAAFVDWRRKASTCNGALVLFLKDLWPAAGWGLIDDSGTPKACYHYLKRVLQPLNVSITDEGGNGLSLHLINETAFFENAELELSIWRDGSIEVSRTRHALELPPRSAKTLNAAQLLNHFSDLSYAYRFGPLQHTAIVATLLSNKGGQLAQAFHFPGGLTDLRQADVGLSATAKMLPGGHVELQVSAEQLALAVHFDAPGFEAQDEYFHLVPGTSRRVILFSHVEGTPAPGCVYAVNSMKPGKIAQAATWSSGPNK